MAERHETEETRAGETHPPPLTTEQFEASPEFRHMKTGMRKLLKVRKAELDERVQAAKEASPRTGNPRAPGAKSRR